ncbi:hypothetical protein BJP48_21805 [Paenibacillus odorifer]|nr:hypothetical protein BJP48_21805 [Paenibacillus odorifer]
MAAFYRSIRPPTTMVVYGFILPVTHRFQGALNGFMLHLFALLKPTVKALGGDLNIRRVLIPAWTLSMT